MDMTTPSNQVFQLQEDLEPSQWVFFKANTVNVELNANLGCPVPALSSIVKLEHGVGVGTGHNPLLHGHI